MEGFHILEGSRYHTTTPQIKMYHPSQRDRRWTANLNRQNGSARVVQDFCSKMYSSLCHCMSSSASRFLEKGVCSVQTLCRRFKVLFQQVPLQLLDFLICISIPLFTSQAQLNNNKLGLRLPSRVYVYAYTCVYIGCMRTLVYVYTMRHAIQRA